MESEAPPVFAHCASVLFQHTDAAGIVFFGRAFEYFHDAWVGLLADAGEPLPRALAEKRWFAPLVHAEADYKRPLRFGDAITTRIDRIDCEGSKAIVHYRIVAGGRTALTGCTVHLFVNEDFSERIAIPDVLATRFAQTLSS